MKRFLLTVMILPGMLLAFTPGKWSHLDQYTMGGKKWGPSKEVVKNKSGEVIYTAKYEYDAEGRLTGEFYFDKNNKPDGKTVFAYKDNKLVSETLYDWNDIVKEKKVFEYNGSALSKIVLYDGNKEVELVCVVGEMKNGIVSHGETKWKVSDDTEKFQVSPDKKNKNVLVQVILDKQENKVGEVRYYFDSAGNLEKRENEQQGQKRLNKLSYSKSGQLENYSFHVKQGNGWDLVKTHHLIYENKKQASLAN